MPALTTLTLVWLGTATPNERATTALESWAKEHAFKLEPPRSAAPDPREGGRDALAARCDAELDQARDQLQAGDDGAAARTLDGVEATLRAHPEILQASWLMAERFRLQARLARPTSLGEAAEWERRADLLEGVRAPPFGEATAPRAIPPLSISASIAVHGAREYAVYWDGALASAVLQTTPGEHHLLIFRGSRVAWAGWVSALLPGKIDVWVPEAEPCSAEDLQGIKLDDRGHIRVPAKVRCEAWTAAFSPSDAAISIATCRGDACRAAETWASDSAKSARAAEPTSPKGFPAWVTWTLTGAGAAAATSFVLWQTGVFSKSSERRVVYDGSQLGSRD